MKTSSSRLVIAGLSGDAGKTIASLSILTALRDRGLSVSVFKKGPDYIDPAWLSSVSRTACRSLDTYMVDPEAVVRNFVVNADESDISVIEGNRGLFDGKDVSGTHSTAQLAKLLEAPVVLVVNAAKSTRTVAAIVKRLPRFRSRCEHRGRHSSIGSPASGIWGFSAIRSRSTAGCRSWARYRIWVMIRR